MKKAYKQAMAIGISQILVITFAILLFLVFVMSFKARTGGLFG